MVAETEKKPSSTAAADSSMVIFHCPNCQAKLAAPESALNRAIRCPKCTREFRELRQPRRQAGIAAAGQVQPPKVVPPPVVERQQDGLHQLTKQVVAAGIAALVSLGFALAYNMVSQMPRNETQVATNSSASGPSASAENAATQPVTEQNDLKSEPTSGHDQKSEIGQPAVTQSASGRSERQAGSQPKQQSELEPWATVANALMKPEHSKKQSIGQADDTAGQSLLGGQPAGVNTTPGGNPALRPWTDNTGQHIIQAEFDSVYSQGNVLMVRLRTADGIIDVPNHRLGLAERDFVVAAQLHRVKNRERLQATPEALIQQAQRRYYQDQIWRRDSERFGHNPFGSAPHGHATRIHQP